MHLWRKLLSLAVTILFAMLILSFSTLALAWTYEEAYHTSEDLPRQVASLLPAEETMLYGYRNGDTASRYFHIRLKILMFLACLKTEMIFLT